MDEQDSYISMIRETLKCYIDPNLNYVEEFDTIDGDHHVWIVKPENWTPQIIQAVADLNL